MTLLRVENLHTHFVSRNLDNEVTTAKALNAVSFELSEGETLGLVGETGAGKSLTALSIMGLLRPPARVVEGSVVFRGQDLLQLSQEQLNKLRGAEMSMVVQNPRASLDPLMKVGQQIVRVLRAHQNWDIKRARAKALEVMQSVGIPDPERRANAWPHELSGGMAQRALIAMALVNKPKMLIADEPTTGLDVTVQAQILDLLQNLVSAMNMGAIIITHDLGVVAHYCKRVAVMFAGQIVETGPVAEVFVHPKHPYTKSLIKSTPEKLNLDSDEHYGGAPPNLFKLPHGCYYADRCNIAEEICKQPPVMVNDGSEHKAMCHFANGIRRTEPVNA